MYRNAFGLLIFILLIAIPTQAIDFDYERFASPGVITAVLSPNGRYLWAGDFTGGLVIRDLKRRRSALTKGRRHQWSINQLAVSLHGKFYASASVDGEAIIWSKNGRLKHYLPHPGIVAAVCFSPNEKLLATAGEYNDQVMVWEVNTGRRIATFPRSGGYPRVAFVGDFEIVDTSDSGLVRIWSLVSGKLLRSWIAHESGVRALAVTPGNLVIATAGGYRDRTDTDIKLWVANTGQLLSVIPNPATVTALAFSPGNAASPSRDELAIGSADGITRIYRNLQVDEDYDSNPSSTVHRAIFSLSYAGRGRKLAITNATNTVTLWRRR